MYCYVDQPWPHSGDAPHVLNCSPQDFVPNESKSVDQNNISAHLHDSAELGTQKWQDVAKRAISNTVIIKFCHTRPFDGGTAGGSEATGFVVDAEGGIVLTNRHVAGPAPFWGSCIFNSQEEVPCHPIYIDPVHDFAFLKYDPQAINHTCIDGLPLSPVRATVGLQVLVVGNDAAQTISMVFGVISRIDRNAPEYEGPYRDFNINYYQANLNLSGGSSGSPAVAADGSVIGMVSGGLLSGESITYLLPLHPISTALELIRHGKPVPRGDIQCQFLVTPFHECRRLGLYPDLEERIRGQQSYAGGMLAVSHVLLSGSACGKIMVGDILLELNGRLILHFEDLGVMCDQNVGKIIEIRLLRDGQLVTAKVGVADLHSITPTRLISVGGLFCHDLSYVQAITYGVPIAGVYVAKSSQPFMIGDGDPGWIIKKMGDRAMDGLEDLLQLFQTTRRGQRIAVTYSHIEKPLCRRMDVLTLDAPGGVHLLSRDDETGVWKGVVKFLPPTEPAANLPGLFPNSRASQNRHLAEVISGLIHVESRAYVCLDGFSTMQRQGMGVVVDSKVGLVLVSRLIIPHKACHVTITFNSTTTVEGQCLFWHPHHCYVFIQYDPMLAPEGVPCVRLSTRRLGWGEGAKFVRFNQPGQILYGDAKVGKVTVTGPEVGKDSFTTYTRCRPINVDLVNIDAPSAARGANGVLVDSDRSVSALWLPYIGGITAPSIAETLSSLQCGRIPSSYIFPAEFEEVSIVTARTMGLPEDVIAGMIAAEIHHPQIYKVKTTICGMGTGVSTLLEDDIVISVDDKFCTNWSDFNVTSPRSMRGIIMREGSIMALNIHSIHVDDLETDRCIEFCGAYIQRPHLAVRHCLEALPSEVYVTYITPGSPADRYSLPPKSFITMINGRPVGDFDYFVDVVRGLSEDRTDTVFTVMATTLTGAVVKLAIRQNNDYFPPVQWSLNGDYGGAIQ